jgi:peroxiredoxin
MMDLILLSIRLLLAVVFAAAALSKLVGRADDRQAVRDFGVPSALVAVVAIGLPPAELVIALALPPASTGWWAAVAGLTLLVLFSAGITTNLVRGRRPACRCFGRLSATPLGWPTLARTGVLAGLAAVVVVAGRGSAGPGPVDWLTTLDAPVRVAVVTGVLVAVLVGANGWLTLELFRQNGRLLVRVETLESILIPADAGRTHLPITAIPAGTPARRRPAPDFALRDLDGDLVTLDALRAGPAGDAERHHPVILVFADLDCGACTQVYPHLAGWQHDQADAITTVLVSRGPDDRHRALRERYDLTRVLLDDDGTVMSRFEIPGTPAAVLVGPDGLLDGDVVAGAAGIFGLVGRAVDRYAATRPAVLAGDGRR